MDFNTIINDAISNGCPVIAVANKKITEIGFNPNYSLSVLKCSNKGGIELRSSFGTIV